MEFCIMSVVDNAQPGFAELFKDQVHKIIGRLYNFLQISVSGRHLKYYLGGKFPNSLPTMEEYMPRVKIFTAVFVFLSVLVLGGCSQDESPTAARDQDSHTTSLLKPPNQTPTYVKATHSQLGSATSYIDGILPAMTVDFYGSNSNCSNLGTLSGNGTLTFHGLIADKIRSLCGFGGSGDIPISCSSLIHPDCYGTAFQYIDFQNGGDNYQVIVGLPSSNLGTVTGSTPTTLTVTFDNRKFKLLRYRGNPMSFTMLWNTSDVPNSVSYQIVTSTP